MHTADRLEADIVGISEHCHETLNMYSHVKAIPIQNSVVKPWFAA
jgi:hypothetical protein